MEIEMEAADYEKYRVKISVEIDCKTRELDEMRAEHRKKEG